MATVAASTATLVSDIPQLQALQLVVILQGRVQERVMIFQYGHPMANL
jgi:hypothetical protein